MTCESDVSRKLSLSQQWMNLVSNDDALNLCDNVQSCVCTQRLLLIMDIYAEQQNMDTNNMYDVITGQLNYDIATFINDYHHFKYHHLINDDHYENVFNQIQKCAINNCQIIRRNERKRIMSNKTKQKTNNDAAHIALLEILDSIHSTIYHQYDLFRHSQNDQHLEFANKQKHKLLYFGDYQRIRSFLKSKRSVFGPLAMENNRKNKFVTVIQDFDKNENDTENKYDDQKIESSNNNKYQFGFCYAVNCCNFYHKHGHKILTAKYRNIKEEMLRNTMGAVPLTIWKSEQAKARHIQKTNKSKSNYMLTSNILSVLLYCNIHDLQYHFSQTYRLISPTDSEEKARERHREFMHWADKLRETVYKFGKRSNKTVYHVINQPMLFGDASIYFYSPTSTTTNLIVAHHFSTNDGIIISINGMQNKCLDCSWLSDFEYEKEYLFMEGYQGNLGYQGNFRKLRIVGVIDCKTGINYKHFFEAMNFLNDALFSASPLSFTLRIVTRKFTLEDIDIDLEEALRMLICYRLNNLIDNHDEKEDDIVDNEESMEYVYKIFDMFCSSKDNIMIETSVCEYIMSLINRENDDLDVFMQLFPNIKTICLSHWSIHKDFAQILKLIDNYINIEMIGLTPIPEKIDGVEIIDLKSLQKQLGKRYWSYYIRSGVDIILSSNVTYKQFESVRVSEAFITTVTSEVNPFPTQYTVYKVIILQNQKEYHVNKRYSEFYALFKHLKMKGYASISEFPSKTWMSSSGPTTANDNFLKNRLSMLNKWIQEVFEKSFMEHRIGWRKDLSIFLKSYIIKGSYTNSTQQLYYPTEDLVEVMDQNDVKDKVSIR